MSDPLHIETFTLGMWQTNCYVVHIGEGGDAWVVDAGFDPAPMIDAIKAKQLGVQQVVLTHAHVDHIAGLQEVVDAVDGDPPILIHEAEAAFLTDTTLNLSAMAMMPVVAPEATRLLAGGETLELGPHRFEVRHTPGHSPGGVCLYCEQQGVAIVGDTLFAGSIGRYDFPTSDGPALMRSIRERLLTLPDDTRVLPGHGPATTVGQERRSNPYLQS